VARRSRIVIVDDEVDSVAAYAEYLSDLGHDVLVVPSTAELDILLARDSIDLVILDLNMPGERGLDALRRLGKTCPILILSAQADYYERVVGLELGADDFVSKPVDPRELAARVLGVLQRYGRVERELIAFERTTVDLTAACLMRENEAPERLSPGEILLVRAFVGHPNVLLSREKLIELAPGESHDVDTKAIDNRIARLRAKLDTESIVTVRGRGYMFVPSGDAHQR
jgi:DNA-binding response OmpR family regulator